MTSSVLGVDEVGRGPWAGPLVAAAVSLKYPITDLRDSKLITPLERERLYKAILKASDYVGVGWASSQHIDTAGLTDATTTAMKIATAAFDEPQTIIIIDGSYPFLTGDNIITMAKADNRVLEVAAASIVAKVLRDAYMYQMHLRYPEYGFSAHVGYGTPYHRRALEKHGICTLHRTSFRPMRDIAEVKA